MNICGLDYFPDLNSLTYSLLPFWALHRKTKLLGGKAGNESLFTLLIRWMAVLILYVYRRLLRNPRKIFRIQAFLCCREGPVVNYHIPVILKHCGQSTDNDVITEFAQIKKYITAIQTTPWHLMIKAFWQHIYLEMKNCDIEYLSCFDFPKN